MPKPQVTNDDTALLKNGLTRTSYFSPLLEQLLFDPTTCSLTMLAFLDTQTR